MSSMSRRHLIIAATGCRRSRRVAARSVRPGRGAGSQPDPSRSIRWPIRPMRWSRISMPRRWRSITTGITRPMSPTSTLSPRIIRRSPRSRSPTCSPISATCRTRSAPACATTWAATPTTRCSGRSWDRTAASLTAKCSSAIDRDLGGMEKFQTDFNAAGGRVFGSGWVFVTVTKDGKLAIETRPNQDNPIMDGKRAARQRRLGARLLPDLSEPPAGLPQGVVEHGELESRGRALCGGEGRHARRMSR